MLKGFLHVVVSDTACHDPRFLILLSLVSVFTAVEHRHIACHHHLVLLVDEGVVFLAGDTWKQHPCVGGYVDVVFLAGIAHHNSSARVGETSHHAQQHRFLDFLRVVECGSHHVVGLLLV